MDARQVHPLGEGRPRTSRLVGWLALAGGRSGSRVGDAFRLPALEDDHLAAAVDGRWPGDVRNPDEPDCRPGETDDERQERKGGNVSARRLLMNGGGCGLADNRNLGFDDLGPNDVVRPVVGHMSARGHERKIGRLGARAVPRSSYAICPRPRAEHGRTWDRTRDLSRVKRALSR